MESQLYGGKCGKSMNFSGNLPETTSMSMQSLNSRHMKTLFTINRLRSLGMAENSMGKMSLQYAWIMFIYTRDFYTVNVNINMKHVLYILKFLFLAVQKMCHFSSFIF